MARANGLHLAMSNPCFELWVALHFQENPGPHHRHHLQALCAAHMPRVPKKHLDFRQVIVGYDDARKRAARLEAEAEEAGERCRNPTTEVFHLTQSIDSNGQARSTAVLDRSRSGEESRAKAAAAAERARAQAAEEAAREGNSGEGDG
jgi:hypothetical protein